MNPIEITDKLKNSAFVDGTYFAIVNIHNHIIEAKYELCEHPFKRSFELFEAHENKHEESLTEYKKHRINKRKALVAPKEEHLKQISLKEVFSTGQSLSKTEI